MAEVRCRGFNRQLCIMFEQRPVIDTPEAARADLPALRSNPDRLQHDHSLPFGALSDDEFEILCFLLLLREHPDDRVLYYGKTGDLGRDIVHITRDGYVRFVQCKRYTNNVGSDAMLTELAKVATNLHHGRYPHAPHEVAWYVVPGLTSPATDILEDQKLWRGKAQEALKRHLEPIRKVIFS